MNALDVIDAIDQGFAIFDTDDRLVVANRVYKDIFRGIQEIIEPGVPFETLIRTAAERQQNIEAITDPEAWVQGRLSRHRAASGVYEHKFSDGRWIQVRERRTEAGNTIGTYTDVTSLVQRTEEVSHYAAALQSILHCIPQAVVVFSGELKAVSVSAQTSAVLNTPLKVSDGLAVLAAAIGWPVVQRIQHWALAHEGTSLELDEVETATGRTLMARANSMSTSGFVITFTDVTEQRKAAAMAHQSQKLVALGQLTGGVAHEFNNLLTSISGFARMARKHVDDPEDVADCLDEVITAAGRAADLTRQMLSFSRKDCFEEKSVVAAELVTSLVKMMTPMLPETVHLSAQIDDPEGRVLVDASHFSQALMNLVLNARDAMLNGGRVKVRVSRSVPTEGTGAQAWMKFEVIDDGSGIDAAILSSIFDPFFTTKDPGKGTGLGLSVVHSTVQRFGGHITVDSIVGQGTTFTLHVPLDTSAVGTPSDVEDSTPIPSARRAGTILVIEDDQAVRDLVAKTLRRAGHRLLLASDRNSALRAIADAPEQIDLLLSDVVLPGKSGPEIAAEIRQSRPDLKLLFMSGYIAQGTDELGLLGTQHPVLSKPFAPDTLCQRVSSLLEASPYPLEPQTEPSL